MDKRSDANIFPQWLSPELVVRVRKIFEPKYNRPLTDDEVVLIAENFTSFIEHFLKLQWRLTYGNK